MWVSVTWLGSSAFGIATVETGQAAVHHDGGLGVAFLAELGAFWEVTGVLLVAQVNRLFVLGAFFINQFLLVLVRTLFLEQADHDQVAVNGITDLGHQ